MKYKYTCGKMGRNPFTGQRIKFVQLADNQKKLKELYDQGIEGIVRHETKESKVKKIVKKPIVDEQEEQDFDKPAESNEEGGE
tara:strand:+ start:564 stop:812 length:249 start_codon:yes stop_codon:yes gene_type:complete